MNSKKAKNAKREVHKLRIHKPWGAKIVMKLVWKILEVARGKSPLS
jgi:thiamine biosynthesis protein ThiC